MKRCILAICCVIAASAPVLGEVAKESLASLIQAGNNKEALARIRAGADVNEAQPDGTRPVHWAVYHVDYELLGALLAKKAKVNVTNDFGSTPIAEAAKLGDARMVKMLLDAGANVNRIEEFRSQTPLMWAATAPSNAGEMVKLLLSKGADVRPRALYTDWPNQITSEPRAQYRPVGGLTALLYAARDGCYDCVEALIAAGADVNVPTPEGVTPLMLALDNQQNGVAKLLLERSANPHVWDWWGRTALYIAIDRRETARASKRPANSSMDSSMEMINLLLAAGVDPNTQLNMHRPSRGGNSGRFGDPLLSTGCTPLLRATMGNDMEVVQALLAKGASPNINDMGMTAFLVAAGFGGGRGFGGQAGASGVANIALMDLLLQHGADVNAQVTGTKTYSMRVARAPSTNEGMSALHIAAQSGRADVVRFLLDKGANAGIVDSNGHQPIDLVGISPPSGRGGATPEGAGAAKAASNPANVAEIRELLRDSVSHK